MNIDENSNASILSPKDGVNARAIDPTYAVDWPTPPFSADAPARAYGAPNTVNYSPTSGDIIDDVYSVVMFAGEYGVITAATGKDNYLRISGGDVGGVVGTAASDTAATYVNMDGGSLANIEMWNGVARFSSTAQVTKGIFREDAHVEVNGNVAFGDAILYNIATMVVNGGTFNLLGVTQAAQVTINAGTITKLNVMNHSSVTITGGNITNAFIWAGYTRTQRAPYIAGYDNATWTAMMLILEDPTLNRSYALASGASGFSGTINLTKTDTTFANFLGTLTLGSRLAVGGYTYALSLSTDGDLALRVMGTVTTNWAVPPFAVAERYSRDLINNTDYLIGADSSDLIDGEYSVVMTDGSYGVITANAAADNYIRIIGGEIAQVTGTAAAAATDTYVYMTGGTLELLKVWNGITLAEDDAVITSAIISNSASMQIASGGRVDNVQVRGAANLLITDGANVGNAVAYNSATIIIAGGYTALAGATQSTEVFVSAGTVGMLNIMNHANATITGGDIEKTYMWLAPSRRDLACIVGYDNATWGMMAVVMEDYTYVRDYVLATDAASFNLELTVNQINSRPQNKLGDLRVGSWANFSGATYSLRVDADNNLVLSVLGQENTDWAVPPFAEATRKAQVLFNGMDYTVGDNSADLIDGVYSIVMKDGDFGIITAGEGADNYLRISGGVIDGVVGNSANAVGGTYVYMTGGELASLEVLNGITLFDSSAVINTAVAKGTANLEVRGDASIGSATVNQYATMTVNGGVINAVVASQSAVLTVNGGIINTLNLKNRSSMTVNGGSIGNAYIWANTTRSDKAFIVDYDNATWNSLAVVLDDYQHIGSYKLATGASTFDISVSIFQTNTRYHLADISLDQWFVLGLTTYALTLTADGDLYLNVLGGVVSDWPAPPFDPNFPLRVARVLGNHADYLIGTELPDFTDGVYSVVMTKDAYGHITAGEGKDNYIRISGGMVKGVTGTTAGAAGGTFVYMTGGELASLEVWNGITLFGRSAVVGNATAKGSAYMEIRDDASIDSTTINQKATMLIAGGELNFVVASQYSTITMTGGAITGQLHLKNRASIAFDGSNAISVENIWLWASGNRADYTFIENLDTVTYNVLSVIAVDATEGYYTLATGADNFNSVINVYTVNTRNFAGAIGLGQSISVDGVSYALGLDVNGTLYFATIRGGMTLDWWDGNPNAPVLAKVFSGTGTVVMGQDGYVAVDPSSNSTAMVISGASAATIYGSDDQGYQNSWIKMLDGEEVTIYGAGGDLTGSANIDISNGSTDLIVGGGAGSVGGVDLHIGGGSHNQVYAGADLNGTVDGDVRLNITGGDFSGVINGGLGAVNGDVEMAISGVTCSANIIAGAVNSYVVGDISLVIDNSAITGMINGGGRAEGQGGVAVANGTTTTITGTTHEPNEDLFFNGFNTAFVFGGGHAVRGGMVYNTGLSTIIVDGSQTSSTLGYLVGGGAADGAGSVAMVADTAIYVSGNVNIRGHIMGGGYAHNGGYSSVENTFISITANDGMTVSIDGNIYGGSYTPMLDGSFAVVDGTSTISFSGIGAFLDFTGKVNGSSFRDENGGVNGVKSLCFDSFVGEFNATIVNMDVVAFNGETAVIGTVGYIGSEYTFRVSDAAVRMADTMASGFAFDDTVVDNVLNIYVGEVSVNYAKALMELSSDANLAGMSINLFSVYNDAFIGSFTYGDVLDLGSGVGFSLDFENDTLKAVGCTLA